MGGYTSTTWTTPTTTTTTTTTSTSRRSDALSELAALAAADRPELRSSAVDWWVPQLSSKKPGLVADGITYDSSAILAEHLRLRAEYPDTRLVWSGDWASFKYRDYWVTLAGERFSSSQAANAWCDQRGFPKDNCYAKRLTTTGGYDGNTKPR